MSGTEAIGLLIGIGWVTIGVSVLIVVINYVNKTKSHWYRKFVTNLFIAGKVRQIAEKEKVDLEIEYLQYLKYSKLADEKKRMDIDDEIEMKLADELTPEEEEKKKGK